MQFATIETIHPIMTVNKDDHAAIAARLCR